VPPTADGGKHVILGAEFNRRLYVSDVHALHDKTRTFVNHPVVHFARGMVVRMGRVNDFAPDRAFELLNRLWHDMYSFPEHTIVRERGRVLKEVVHGHACAI
jgi:hypothetical protein